MRYERDEPDAVRYDRNWAELLQELRVTQTGVQILAGFLVTLPFTDRFGDLDRTFQSLYLTAFALSTLSVGLLITPVALHRILFARREKDTLVRLGGLLAKLGLVSLALTLITVSVLIFGVVASLVAGVVAGAVVTLFFVLAWAWLPWWVGR